MGPDVAIAQPYIGVPIVEREAELTDQGAQTVIEEDEQDQKIEIG